MLVSQIKRLFFTRIDEFASAYWDNTRLNDLFLNSQTEVFEDLMDKYQLDNSITEAVLPLVKYDSVTVGTNINLDVDLNNPYQRLITIIPTFVQNGVEYTYYAEQLSAEESNSVYAQGTIRYPRYDQYSVGSDKIVKIYPTSNTPTVVVVNYFMQPITIDFDAPTTDIPYPKQTVELILNKAVQIAAATIREDAFFQTESALMNQGKTAHQ